MTFKMLTVAVVVAALCSGSVASAQTEPLGGQPAPGAKQSVSNLDEQVAYQRAFDAVLWASPHRQFIDFAPVYWNSPAWPIM